MKNIQVQQLKIVSSEFTLNCGHVLETIPEEEEPEACNQVGLPERA
jgi:hypothetical protein